MSIRRYIEITTKTIYNNELDYIIKEKKMYKKPLFAYGDDFHKEIDCILIDYTNQECCGIMEIMEEDFYNLKKNKPEKYAKLIKKYPNKMKRIKNSFDENISRICSLKFF